ncbi:MAG: hypothetical protein OXG71_11440, partial [Rhodospirillales bacterium]|nr:hypothetical protein [Rhodospirillales bacterium]
MPIPLIPIVTALGGATAGFLVGRYMFPDFHGDTFLPGPEDEQGQRSEESESGPSSMTEAEAFRILELEAGATADEIKEAHRRLIQGLH